MAGKFAYNALVIDLDGTLLNSAHQIAPCDAAALAAVRALGVPVLVVTGRSLHEIAVFNQHLCLPGDSLVLEGGVVIMRYFEDRVVTDAAIMPPACRRALAEIAKRHNFYPLVNVGEDVVSMPQDNPLFPTFVRLMAGLPIVEDDTLDARLEQVITGKMVMLYEPEVLVEVEQEMVEANVTCPWGNSLGYGIDVVARSKAQALQKLLDDLGMAAQDVLTIGDSNNDIEVLQMCGRGVAMANSMPGLLAVAHEVTKSNDEGGVAATLHTYFGV